MYVNHDWKGRYALLFGTQRDDIQIDYQDAQRLGIDLSQLPRPQAPLTTLSIATLVQGGRFDMDVGALSLRLTVPQARSTGRRRDTWIRPSGIAASPH